MKSIDSILAAAAIIFAVLLLAGCVSPGAANRSNGNTSNIVKVYGHKGADGGPQTVTIYTTDNQNDQDSGKDYGVAANAAVTGQGSAKTEGQTTGKATDPAPPATAKPDADTAAAELTAARVAAAKAESDRQAAELKAAYMTGRVAGLQEALNTPVATPLPPPDATVIEDVPAVVVPVEEAEPVAP